jgi:gamma-D-glutamyl-L-lysine dipeptidyl-peptidase
MSCVVANKAIISLMELPTTESYIVDEIFYGSVVQVLEENSDWYRLQTEYRYIGFAKKCDFIYEKNIVNKWITMDKYLINNKSVDVLNAPKVQSRLLINLTLGCTIHKVRNTKDIQGYSLVCLLSGERGYVRSAFIQNQVKIVISDDMKLRDGLIEIAKIYLGTQYRWGGKSLLGIDCSGLASMVYMLNGILINRDSCILKDFPIKKIDYIDIKKGDLIYFTNHIGIYVDNGIFIHSSEEKNGVVYNSLNIEHSNYCEKLANSILYIGTFDRTLNY